MFQYPPPTFSERRTFYGFKRKQTLIYEWLLINAPDGFEITSVDNVATITTPKEIDKSIALNFQLTVKDGEDDSSLSSEVMVGSVFINENTSGFRFEKQANNYWYIVDRDSSSSSYNKTGWRSN